MRGLPISLRSPQAGRIVCGLREAKVRNPIMMLEQRIRRQAGDRVLRVHDPRVRVEQGPGEVEDGRIEEAGRSLANGSWVRLFFVERFFAYS